MPSSKHVFFCGNCPKAISKVGQARVLHHDSPVCHFMSPAPVRQDGGRENKVAPTSVLSSYLLPLRPTIWQLLADCCCFLPFRRNDGLGHFRCTPIAPHHDGVRRDSQRGHFLPQKALFMFISEKSPRPFKKKFGTSTPLSKPPSPAQSENFMGMGVLQQKESKNARRP